MDTIYDVIIIGAGPAGVSAAIYAKRSGLNLLLIEKNMVGGQVVNAYEIENYPGFPKVNGFDLALSFSEQLKFNEIKVQSESIKKIDKINDIFEVVSESDKKFFAKNVILALGSNPRKLGLDKEDAFRGRGVSYCATCDGAFYRNKEVAVIGGGNSAISEALYLSDIVSKIYIIVRSHLRADEAEIEKLKNKDNIEILQGFSIKELLGEKELEGVLLINKNTNETKRLSVSGLFVYIGQVPPTQFLDNFDIRNNTGHIIVDKNYQTKIKGLFAIGDVIEKDLRQIVGAVSDGANVINFIKENLN